MKSSQRQEHSACCPAGAFPPGRGERAAVWSPAPGRPPLLGPQRFLQGLGLLVRDVLGQQPKALDRGGLSGYPKRGLCTRGTLTPPERGGPEHIMLSQVGQSQEDRYCTTHSDEVRGCPGARGKRFHRDRRKGGGRRGWERGRGQSSGRSAKQRRVRPHTA